MAIAGTDRDAYYADSQASTQKDATEWIKQGRQLWQKKDISGAISAYQQASNLEPKNSRI
ncbi:hypothetical protein HCU40_24170 [Pseudanabaena biceps]|nr:hypothetical protein [Pseudanabaena biceps]